MTNVKIHYLFNSGFTLETDEVFCVFDYFRDSVSHGKKCLANGAVDIEELPMDKKIIVFSSHSHQDHFNPVILGWQAKRPQIQYVLSSDIKIREQYERIHMMSAYEWASIAPVEVKSFGSTDIGVSYLVKINDLKVFHAGDLNWWYWWDDTEEEIEKAEIWFKAEIERIIGEEIDIAFFPVDPRLEHNYCLGAKYFIEKLKPRFLFPMHFGNSFKTTAKFKLEAADFKTEIMEIEKRGQEFNLIL